MQSFVEDQSAQRVAVAAAAVDPQLPAGVCPGDRGEGADQEVEALLRGEPAGRDDDLRVELRGAGAERLDRVRQALDPRRPGQLARVVLAVALGQDRERVERSVAAADRGRERRPVRVEVHVLLRDHDRPGRGDRLGQQRPGGPRRDDDVAARRAQPPHELEVGPDARRRIRVVLRMHEQARQPHEQPLDPAPPLGRAVVEARHAHPGREGEERLAPQPPDRDQLDLVALAEVAREVERGAHRAAHRVRVREDDAHRGRPAGRRAARRRQPPHGGERDPVQRDRRLAEDPAAARDELALVVRRLLGHPRRPDLHGQQLALDEPRARLARALPVRRQQHDLLLPAHAVAGPPHPRVARPQLPGPVALMQQRREVDPRPRAVVLDALPDGAQRLRRGELEHQLRALDAQPGDSACSSIAVTLAAYS